MLELTRSPLTPFLAKLDRRNALSMNARDAFMNLRWRGREVRSHRDIVREGDSKRRAAGRSGQRVDCSIGPAGNRVNTRSALGRWKMHQISSSSMRREKV